MIILGGVPFRQRAFRHHGERGRGGTGRDDGRGSGRDGGQAGGRAGGGGDDWNDLLRQLRSAD